VRSHLASQILPRLLGPRTLAVRARDLRCGHRQQKWEDDGPPEL